MSDYYAVVREGQDDHLEHLFGFGKKKGSQKKNHKYVARVQVGSGWRYFYSNAEYAAYQAGKTAGNIAGGAKKAAGAIDSKLGVGAAIRKSKAGKDMKKAAKNQGKNLLLAATTVAADSNFKPGGKYEKELANTLLRDKRITQRKVKEYGQAKGEYDKTLLGKISNSGVGKVTGGALHQVKRVAKGASEKAKKGYHDLGWDVHNYKDKVQDENGKTTVTKATYFRKRNRLAKLLGLPGLNFYKLDRDSVAVGTSDDGTHYQWSNRPHSRKQKIEAGTVTVKKKKKVKSK